MNKNIFIAPKKRKIFEIPGIKGLITVAKNNNGLKYIAT